ncbi:MAG: WD40 repeat domain-containing protein [Vulcanimicrobiota bacterium]
MRLQTLCLALLLTVSAAADNVSFSESGGRVASCSSSKGKAQVYDLGKKKLLVTIPVTYAALLPDGKHLVGVGSDSKLHYFDASTGKQLWKGSDEAKRFELSSDGRYVLVEDRVYGSKDGKLVGKWAPPNAFSPDAKYLLHGSYDSIEVRALPSGKVEREAKVAGIVGKIVASPGEVACAYSPDGRRTSMVLLGYPNFELKRNFDNAEAQASPDGSLSWSGDLIVSYNGKEVYRGKTGERVSVWGKGGGFLVGKGRKPFGFFSSSGVGIPNGEKSWRLVPGSTLGYTFVDGKVNIYHVVNGARYGEIGDVEAVGDSAKGGFLGLATKSGLQVIDTLATRKKAKLISVTLPKS